MHRVISFRYKVAITGLLLVAIAVFEVACRKEGAKASTDAPPLVTTSLSLRFPQTALGPIVVDVTVPKAASSGNPKPVLIALHGQGESRKSPERGARGWADDYAMLRAFSRLEAPPLRRDDFGGMIDDARLTRLNASLRERPFRGLVVVSPYLPDRFRAKHLFEEAGRYGDFLVKEVLPRVRRETPALDSVAATGIDGVSLGGRVSVVAGLMHPETFGAVGGMQAAFGEKQIASVVSLLKEARAKQATLDFWLMSSKRDRFLKVTRLMSDALNQAGERHRVDILEGDHSYAFNRGPGVYEMLLYYDRVLRGEPFL